MSGFPTVPEAPADMLELARVMKARAYAPYSRFAVGAVVRGESGRLYGGCNVENAAYPQSSCAEAAAITALVAGGERRVTEALVLAGGPDLVTPCGGCRQRLREFASDATSIHLCGEGEVRTLTLGELLPLSFGPRHLGQNPDQ
jgi:cytidine deaminase